MKNIVIAGNIGKDAVVRTTGNGDKITGFSVAVEDRSRKDKETIWFDVSMWGSRGETLSQYLTKGTRVVVSGDFGKREHEGKTYLTVRADNVTLQGGGEKREEREERPREPAKAGASSYDDEIPF
jgi:single-strand DNA-binding protein